MLYDDLKFITQKEIKVKLESSDMTAIKYFQFTSHYRITFISTSKYSVPFQKEFYPLLVSSFRCLKLFNKKIILLQLHTILQYFYKILI